MLHLLIVTLEDETVLFFATYTLYLVAVIYVILYYTVVKMYYY